MYKATPWLGRNGLLESPTTAMVLAAFSKSPMGSEALAGKVALRFNP